MGCHMSGGQLNSNPANNNERVRKRGGVDYFFFFFFSFSLDKMGIVVVV